MKKSIFSRSHCCPECGGMIRWSSRQCRYCHCDITLSVRWDWADESTRFSLLGASAAFGSLLGYILFNVDGPIVAATLSLGVSLWYTTSVSFCKRESVQ